MGKIHAKGPSRPGVFPPDSSSAPATVEGGTQRAALCSLILRELITLLSHSETRGMQHQYGIPLPQLAPPN
jgi:hypothetical protein